MDYKYKIYEDKEIWIERYLGNNEITTVPASIENLPVRKICQYAFAAADVIEIHVEEGIEIIDAEAFAICEKLESVKLPSSLKKLGRGVFKGCTSLTEIAFPNGNPVYTVDDDALYNVSEQALVLLPPGLETETFTVPMGIKIIASGAFYQNSFLKYVSLPVSLEKIEEGSFLFTRQMRMIELPPNLKEIEPGSFLVGQGMRAEKPFVIFAFPNTVGYRYAVENKIAVRPLYAIVTD